MRKLGSLGGLRSFALSWSDVNPDAFAHVGRLRDLQVLLINDCPNVTDESLSYVQDLPQLRSINIGGCGISDRGIAYLAKLPRMERIQVRGGSIGDASFAHVRALARLESLILENPSITDAGLAHLRGLTNLTHLQVTSPQITDAGLAHAATLTNLQGLVLQGAQISDAGLAQVEHLKGLRALILSPNGTSLTDRALEHLRGLAELKSLSLGNAKRSSTQFSNQALLNLVEGLPKLQFLLLEPPNLAPEFVAQLKQARPGLRVVRVR